MTAAPGTLAFILLAFCGAARATQTVGIEGWRQFGNSDFTVLSQMDEGDTAAWAGRFNQFLHAMRGNLRVDPRVLGPFTIVLFRSKADFWDSAPVLKSGSPLVDLGGFSRTGGWGTMAGSCDVGSNESTQRLLFQTGVAWLLSADPRRRPRALSEGIAEVYSAYVIENNEEVFGRPIHGWTSRLQRAVLHPLDSADRFLEIEDLLAVKDINPVAARHGVDMFWVESWGFTHFMLFSKDMAKRHAFDRLLDAFARNLAPHEALKDALGPDAETINARFYNYIRGGDFYQMTKPVEPAPVAGSPTPADPALVAATLAKLEASEDNLDVALSYGGQAVRLAPNDVRSHEALAFADFIGGRHSAAAGECREAIRLNSRDGWTWFESSEEIGRTDASAGELEDRRHLTPGQARDAINGYEKAILLFKGLRTAYERVAGLMPVADHVTEDDGKFLALGRLLFPNNGWIEIGRAQWARRVHDRKLALGILDDMMSRPAEFTPEQSRKAGLLRKEWAAALP